MRRRSHLLAAVTLVAAVLACNMPSQQQINAAVTALAQTGTAVALTGQGQAPSPPSGAPSATPAGLTATSTATATPTFTPTPCSPFITANMNANVRRGPSTLYEAIGYLPTGGTAPIAGRNDDNTWWYISFAGGPGGYGWIAQSVATASCLPAVVQVIASPPLPPTLTSTPEPVVFAVTSVSFTITGSCPNFHIKFKITTNAAGTVTYHRVWNDGATDTLPGTLVFSAAGTQVGGDYDMTFGVPGGSGWTDVYIDSPNHQQFGRADYSCP